MPVTEVLCLPYNEQHLSIEEISMRRLVSVLLMFGLVAGVSFAQEQSSSNSAQQTEKSSKKDKKDKKKKDKDKDKDSGPKDEINTEVFSQTIANDVLGQIRDGLEGHSSRLMLGAFDQDKMDGYLSFEDQIEALFQRYDSFRVHYRISTSSTEGSKGVVLVDWEMEEMPKSGGSPARRNGQIKFEMERTRKGWKVVDFNPRGIFS
jgi:hypothetical protein